MDKLKVILKHVKKYHFWLLAVVTLIAGLLGSMMAAGSLSAAYRDGKGKIDSKFSALKEILGTESHPNDEWKQGVEKLNGREQVEVRKAWEQVYGEQKSLLTWPAQLGPDFLKFVNEQPPSAEIPRELCELYQEDIKGEFPRLTEIVDAEQAGATKDAVAGQPAHQYKVFWDTTNQGDIRKSLQWDAVPSSAEVRRAQEDLWVYTALLNMIKKINEEQQYKTPIREIDKLAIGRAAVDAFEADGGKDRIKHLRSGDAPPPETPPPPAEAGDGAAKSPDDGRYVDATGKKMPGGAMADAEFKRMPIFLRLKMDQREITRLLVECANSPLPVDVRQLRINPSKGTAKQQGSGGGKSGTASSDGASYDVPIELHGVIYIYNKPNMAKLGGEPGGPGAPGAAPVPVPAG
jgi:hypothetical protein